MSDWTPEVGDIVRQGGGKMTWRIEAIQQMIFILRSGQSGKRAWARREHLTLFEKHDFRRNAA